MLAFPANNFAGQEPGTDAAIKEFCRVKQKATFDLFAKVSVKGDDQCPLYRYLTGYHDEAIAGEVAWNFQKYLVDRAGNVVAKFSPRVLPTDADLVARVEQTLAENVGKSS